MAESFAVNASPLIFLAQADLLQLLQAVAPTGIVPRSVMQELEAGAHIDNAAAVVRSMSWLTVVEDPPVPDTIALWDLGPGESAVLAWALAQAAEAVVDDLQARRCAAALGIAVRGVFSAWSLAANSAE